MNTAPAPLLTAGFQFHAPAQDLSVAQLRESIRQATAQHPRANVGRDSAGFLAGVDVSDSSLSKWAAFDAAPRC